MNVLLAWAVTAGVIAYRDVKSCGHPPVPSEFVASSGIFAALALLGQANEELAGVLAWGFVVAALISQGGINVGTTTIVPGGGLGSPPPGSFGTGTPPPSSKIAQHEGGPPPPPGVK